MFLAGAHDETPDRQGRVTIPPPLRDVRRAHPECTVIGAGSRVEVWDTRGLGRLPREAAEQAFADQSEEVVPGLLLTAAPHRADRHGT